MNFSFPYTGFRSVAFKKELSSLLTRFYPLVDVKIIFHSPVKIGNLFKFKDTLLPLMRSNIVYSFTCPNCSSGTKQYIGCTERTLKVRIDGHRGVSYRTQTPLTSKESSAIRDHCMKCKINLSYNDFKILLPSKSKYSLLILESLLIKSLNPSLNSDQSSIPLFIA